MRYATTSLGGTVEILAVNDHKSVPITVAAPSEGSVVKAGTPLKEDGTSTTGEGAVGILLYDVDTAANPNGALLVAGIVDATKAQAHSGITYTDTLAATLADAGCTINLRTNIGVNT